MSNLMLQLEQEMLKTDQQIIWRMGGKRLISNWTKALYYFCLVIIKTIPYKTLILMWWLLQQTLVLWLAMEKDHAHKFAVQHNKKRDTKPTDFHLTFLSLNMCLLPFPLVDTFFSDAGALYLVLLSRADLLWISCLDWRKKWHMTVICTVKMFSVSLLLWFCHPKIHSWKCK